MQPNLNVNCSDFLTCRSWSRSESNFLAEAALNGLKRKSSRSSSSAAITYVPSMFFMSYTDFTSVLFTNELDFNIARASAEFRLRQKKKNKVEGSRDGVPEAGGEKPISRHELAVTAFTGGSFYDV